tara:strand:+ start:3151 stop:3702 length:552 start_codon:yes stop_codon:yes gene_type:complete
MLSTLKKANSYSTFPLDLQESFNEKKEQLEIYVKIKAGEKIGKSDDKYYVFSNNYTQQAMRWWYEEDRSKTIKYIDEDLGNYINFLDKLTSKIENDVLCIYKTFGTKVKSYNTDLIQGLYILKKTYEDQRLTFKENKEIIAKIDSVILTLIDFKDRITTTTENNSKKMDTLLTINNTIKSFEV